MNSVANPDEDAQLRPGTDPFDGLCQQRSHALYMSVESYARRKLSSSRWAWLQRDERTRLDSADLTQRAFLDTLSGQYRWNQAKNTMLDHLTRNCVDSYVVNHSTRADVRLVQRTSEHEYDNDIAASRTCFDCPSGHAETSDLCAKFAAILAAHGVPAAICKAVTSIEAIPITACMVARAYDLSLDDPAERRKARRILRWIRTEFDRFYARENAQVSRR